MSEVLILDKKSKDKIISVNSLNELLFIIKGEKTEIIYKNVSNDFDALIEENGTINIIAVTLTGSLIYFRMFSDEWKKYTILDSRGGGKRINAVRIMKINGRIHAFYCISYEERMMLIHHIFEGTDFSKEPQVIDYTGLRCAYSVCSDDSYNIHILYSDENSSLKYSVFSNSQKNYIPAKVINEDEVRSINSVYANGKVYASYLSREHDYNVINCIQAVNGEKHTIGFGVDSLSEPCIFTDNKKIFVQWCERGHAFECSAESDFKFCKPSLVGQSAKILKIRSMNNESACDIDKCAGSISKGPLSFAKIVVENHNQETERTFKVKGSDIEQYAKKYMGSFENDFDEFKNYEIEQKLNELEHRFNELVRYIHKVSDDLHESKTSAEIKSDVGEIDQENLEKFNSIDVESSSVNINENEYNESERIKNEEEL